MSARKVARRTAAPAAREGHATSNEVGQKGAAARYDLVLSEVERERAFVEEVELDRALEEVELERAFLEVAAARAGRAKKTRTRRTTPEAVGGWLAFRDTIVDDAPAVRIERIRAGAQPSFLIGAAEALGVSRETVFRVVGLSVSTANRKIAKQETLDPLVTERLARLAVIEKQAEDSFGDPEVARAWLRAENIGLGGYTPLSMLDTDIGSREVAKILVAIAHGGAA